MIISVFDFSITSTLDIVSVITADGRIIVVSIVVYINTVF